MVEWTRSVSEKCLVECLRDGGVFEEEKWRGRVFVERGAMGSSELIR